MGKKMGRAKIAFGTIAGIMLFSSILVYDAAAVPTLQLYIEGSQYDASTQSWLVNSHDPILWVIGDIKSGNIYDVKLTMAFSSAENPSITITPITASPGYLPSSGDASIPVTPVFGGSGYGTIPLTGDGTPLASHGIYGPGVNWVSYELGDFTLQDSPIGDYCNGVPSEFASIGQINAYQININGSGWVHFDTYDHIVVGKNHAKYVFAPFSHDAEATPEPATMALVGLGLAGMLGYRKRKTGA